MARRRYRRYYRKKGRWSPNIQEINTTTVQAPPNSTFYTTYTLSTNPVQVNTGVTQTYTVKRIECSFYIDSNNFSISESLEDIAAYIMFVPQGMTVTDNYNLQHPEYIMAYKYLGSPSNDWISGQGPYQGQQYQPHKVTTRLSRKLQSGDSVVLFIKGNNTATSTSTTYSFQFHGLVRWWTKAN